MISKMNIQFYDNWIANIPCLSNSSNSYCLQNRILKFDYHDFESFEFISKRIRIRPNVISKFSVNGNRPSITPEVYANESNNRTICNWIEYRQYPYIMSLNSIFVYNVSYINRWIICTINSYICEQ